LLGLERLFQEDKEEGSLDVMIMGKNFLTIALIIFIKCLAHWISTVLPLIIVAPFCAILLNMELFAIKATVISLLFGTFAITLIGAVGAALTIALPRGGMMLSIIVLPLLIPVLIFGVSAVHAATETAVIPITPFLFLLAITLLFSIFGPITAAVALKCTSG